MQNKNIKIRSTMCLVNQAIIDAYSEEVEKYAANNLNFEFFNCGEDHALVVLRTITKRANENLSVLCGNLFSRISNHPTYINALKGFFMRGGKLEIVLNEFDETKNIYDYPIYQLFEENLSKITIKTTSKKILGPEGNNIHLTIADKIAYRLETDTQEKKARCNFNSPIANELHSIFTQIFDDPETKLFNLAKP